VHAQELVCVAEAGGLAVVGADLEEGFAVGRGDGAGDVGRETLAGGDGDGGGGEFEFGLVENHGVGAGFHGGRGEGPGGDGFGPVLGRGVEPVHDALHAGDGATGGGGDEAGDAKLAEEGDVGGLDGGDAGAGEGHEVGPWKPVRKASVWVWPLFM